jgi:group II intron reverse transcriptase/maturase
LRNPVFVLNSLQEKACAEGYTYERLYRNLYNPEFYLLAYKNIASTKGSMTAGTDKMTLDGMSLKRIDGLIAKLKDHSYQPKPARREYIEKKNSDKKRPLGIQSSDDRLVQEVVRMILEAIYEPTFSKHSHGFRPKRSCHTALQEVQLTFRGMRWIIEGDIKACFDSFDHHVLTNILRRRISDEYFIALLWKFLKAGYMEQWTYQNTYSGTPQGSGMSPILANIYLSELDTFLEQYRANFRVGGDERRELSREYKDAVNAVGRAEREMERLKAGENAEGRKLAVAALKAAQQTRRDTPCHNAIDPDFKCMQFNRYADDFVIGINGSKADAEQIKADVKAFLQEKLKLTLSEEKTKITHSGELIRYLGYDFSISRRTDSKRDKRGAIRRCWYGAVNLYVPRDKWESKLREYQALRISKGADGSEQWIAAHRGKLINKEDIEIISKYNQEIRGLYNYYRLAGNATVLNGFAYIMKVSMERTFAAKYKSSVSKMRAIYQRDGIWGVDYITKSGSKRCEFYNGGFRKNSVLYDSSVDWLPQRRAYGSRNTFAYRLRSDNCELCGNETADMRMHHIKALKDLTGKNSAEKLMMKKRRKSLALCPKCYETAHLNTASDG